jgi:peptidoglycan/xylan/chitin deacetylase (PgdA/CDA1 family)
MAPISRRSFLTGAAATLGSVGLAACSPSGAKRAASAGGAEPGSRITTTTAGTTPPTTAGPELSPGGPATAVAHGPRQVPQVALTFHLGPNVAGEDLSLAHQLLADAKQLQTPITVFAVGQWLDQHADLVPLILDNGNELDNHTYTHPTLTALNATRVNQEIVGCRDVLARLAPTQGRYFRPSGTAQATPTILAQAGAVGYRTVVDYDVDPLDYTDPGADAILSKIGAELQPGSIVSMHFGHPGTVTAFPRIVDLLQTRGLRPVLVNDLLA